MASMIDEVIEMLNGNANDNDKQDAERWRKLIRLIGTYPNDIECSLSYGLNSGTPVAIIVTRSSHEGITFENVIDSIPEPKSI